MARHLRPVRPLRSRGGDDGGVGGRDVLVSSVLPGSTDDDRRRFLDDLLSTATPSGFEAAGQRVWLYHVEPYADGPRVDACGNAVAVENADITPFGVDV